MEKIEITQISDRWRSLIMRGKVHKLRANLAVEETDYGVKIYIKRRLKISKRNVIDTFLIPNYILKEMGWKR